MAKKTKASPGTGDDSIAASVDAALKQGGNRATAPNAGRRCMFTLTAGAVKLLNTAVLVDDVEPSKIVEDLINTHLAGYHAGKTAAASSPATD